MGRYLIRPLLVVAVTIVVPVMVDAATATWTDMAICGTDVTLGATATLVVVGATAISGVVLAVTEVHLVTRCLATRIRMKGDRDSRRKQRKITRQATAVEETTVMGHGKVVTPAGAAVRVAADGEVAPVATDLVQVGILNIFSKHSVSC